MKYILAIAILLALWQTLSLYWKTGRLFYFRHSKNRDTDPVVWTQANEPESGDLMGGSRFRLRQNMNTGDNTRQGGLNVVHHSKNDSTFGSELQNSGNDNAEIESENDIALTFSRKADLYNEWLKRKALRQENFGKTTLVTGSQVSGEDPQIPERYETIGYVERDDPHRARGVTFESLEVVDKVMEGDHITNDEHTVALETLERLKGTDMGKLLQSAIAGSNEKVKRYINIFVDAGYKTGEQQEPTSEEILGKYRLDDILERKLNR